jgi:5,5'-dehydrodivanillate O-demethylase
MLDQAKNQLLTEVGSGTPMGGLLRRYWMPIAAVTEFDDKSIKPVRVLGEDLTLYKDLSGTYGLVDRQCAHRRADLAYGFVEQCGLRCNYHGWLYDEAGRCTEQPYEDVAAPQANFKDKIRITAYPVEVKAGLIWAYLSGAAPAGAGLGAVPLANGFVEIVRGGALQLAAVPGELDRSAALRVDAYELSVRLNDKLGPYSPRHLRMEFEEFDYGFVYRRLREGMSESDLMWTVGRCCLWPNALFTGDHFEWRVPIDNENTLSVTWAFTRVPKEREPYVQGKIPAWRGPVRDEVNGGWISSHIMNQDFVAWVGQGTVADRTKEHLGLSDRGIILQRQRFLNDLEAIARGEDPKATIRDPAMNKSVPLPVAERKLLVDGLTRVASASHSRKQYAGSIFQAGSPRKSGPRSKRRWDEVGEACLAPLLVLRFFVAAGRAGKLFPS